MKKSVMLCAALSVLSVAALAGPPKSKKVAVKVTDVWTCPMSGEKTDAAHQSGAPVVVGKYRMHFCCGDCPASFNKLTTKQKLQKAEIAAKKDTSKSSKS